MNSRIEELSKLPDAELERMLAELRGIPVECPRCTDPDCCANHAPPTCSDLNAVAPIEDALHANFEQSKRYTALLDRLVSKTKHSGTELAFQVITAKPRQRTIALIATLEK